MPRGFVVIDVPADETMIGQLSAQEPGCTIDMLGRPDVHAGEHLYQLHYVVRNVSPEAKQAFEDRVRERYSKFETLDYDADARTWTVYGEVPVANIMAPGLRFVAGLFGMAPMPWILFENGMGHARLLPGREDGLARVAETLAARMASAGIDAVPRVEIGDLFEQFEARVELAGWDA